MATRRAHDVGPRGGENTLSPNEVGRELGITGEAVKQWIYQHKLPATKLPNGYWRIHKRDLDEFLTERSKGGRRRILLVGAISERLAPEIEAAGWRVLVAHNPVDAVIRATDVRPSVVVIDLISLGDGGWAVAEKLRYARGSKKLPILLIAPEGAEADPDAMDKALAISAQGYLCGDVTAETVLSAAKGLLGA